MGAVDLLRVEYPCMECNFTYERALQYKYGGYMAGERRLGDLLDWSVNTRGRRYRGLVAIDGLDLSDCPNCGKVTESLIIYILDDVVIGIGDLFGEFDAEHNYIVNSIDKGGYIKMTDGDIT